MKAEQFIRLIQYVESKYPGIEFVLPLNGDMFTVNAELVMVMGVDDDNKVIMSAVLSPSPIGRIEIRGYGKTPMPPVKNLHIP